MKTRVLRLVSCLGFLTASMPLAFAEDGGTRNKSDVSPRPHILVFVSDDHGASFTGCYGNPVIRTPHLDALASEGMRFNNMFSASPTCGPARTALCTGMMPPRVGCWRNHGKSKEGTKSLPHYLKALGYRVAISGKVDVHPASVYPFEKIGKKRELPKDIIKALLSTSSEGPFCLMMNSHKPHVPWTTKTTYAPEKIIVPPDMVDTPETRLALAQYYTEITQMDEEVGAWLVALRENDIEKQTLFIYVSDQGGEFPRHKWNLFEGGVRQPFLVRWPGKVRRGSVTDALASSVDLVPTLIEVAGGAPQKGLDGRSFLKTLLDPTHPHREAVWGTHTGNPLHGRGYNDYAIRSLRTATHKYILNLEPKKKWISHCTDSPKDYHQGVWNSWLEKAKTDPSAEKLVQTTQHRPAEELYDLRNDPYELNNLAGQTEHADLLSALRERMAVWREAQGDEGTPENQKIKPKKNR